MEKAEKKQRNLPKKPPAASLRIMPSSMAALFVAASIGRLSHLFPRWMSSKIEKEHDVTSSQLMVLFLISQSNQLTMGQLAEMLDLTPRAITGIMKGLEAKSFITRIKDDRDQRIIWVKLSAKGANFFKIARPDTAEKLSLLLGVLSKKEQIELVRIIEKLTDHMKYQIDES